jgi:hypothetical protein
MSCDIWLKLPPVIFNELIPEKVLSILNELYQAIPNFNQLFSLICYYRFKYLNSDIFSKDLQDILILYTIL